MCERTMRILQPGDEAALEAFLRPRLASSMFLISNVARAGLVDRGGFYEGTYAAAFDSERIVGVVACYWNGNIMPQAPVMLEPLIDLALQRSGREVRGMIGPADQVTAAWRHLKPRCAHLTVQTDGPDGLYELPLDELIVPDPLRRGEVVGRRATLRDRALLTRWRIDFCVEALHAADTPALRDKSDRDIQAAIADGWMWVAEHEGRPVACSALNAKAGGAVQVGGVWTPRDLRGRGYARCAVATSMLDVRRDDAARAILFTPDDNAPAIRAYRSLGFSRMGDFRLILLAEGAAAAAG